MQTSEEKKLIEHIRLRKEMYLGILGNSEFSTNRMYRLLQEVLNYSIDEYRQGYSDIIEVKIENNKTVLIRDNGTGLPFDARTWKAKTFLKTSGIVIDEKLVLNILIALSSFAEITFFQNGLESKSCYKNGVLQEETVKETKQESGTLIRFTPDEYFFKDFNISEDIIFQILRNLTYLNEGLNIIFNTTRMRSTAGMRELLTDKMPRKGYYSYPIIQFKDESIDIAITHSRSEEEKCYSFVNGLYTNLGGTHVSSLKKVVSSVILELYPSCGFVPEDIYSGMVIAISINMEHPMFELANTWKLGSVSFTETYTVKEYIHSFFYEKFKTYLFEHPDIHNIILEKLTLSLNHRKFVQKCLSMSIDKLVELWNDGIENKVLETKELYVILDAFLAKKVQTVEMQRANAIAKRLKIGYDKVFNIIHCSGRFFSETDGVLLPF